MKQPVKNMLRGVFSISGIITALSLAGCCGYQGYTTYDSCTELKKENERVTGERDNLQLRNGKFKIEKQIDYTYDQNLQTVSRSSMIYTEGSVPQVIGNCICYPFTLVFSPLSIPALDDKIKKEFGREYRYSSGRQAWNMLNPLICTSGKLKQKEEILSTKNTKEVRKRTQCVPFREGQIQFISRNKRKTLPVSVSGQEIYQLVFDYPLPEKTENISLAFNGKTWHFTISSTDMLTPEEKKAWTDILNSKTFDQVVACNALKSLDALHKHGKIGDLAYKQQKSELDSLVDAVKFPMKKFCSNRVSLADNLVSGTSWQWFKHFSPGNTKLGVPSCFYGEFNGFSVKRGTEELFFAMEKDFSEGNQDQAVLVRRKFQLTGSVTPEAAIRKILQDNPGAKHEKKQKVTRRKNNLQMVANVALERTDLIETVRTKDKEWCFTYCIMKTQLEFTSYGQHKLSDVEKEIVKQQVLQENGIVDGVTVQISDRNMVKVFSDIQAREIQRRKAAAKKARQEKMKKELDSLSL